MREVNDAVAVVGGNRIVEDELANLAPVPERPADTEWRAVRLPSSVTLMVNVSVRFGTGSSRSKMWAMISSR